MQRLFMRVKVSKTVCALMVREMAMLCPDRVTLMNCGIWKFMYVKEGRWRSPRTVQLLSDEA